MLRNGTRVPREGFVVAKIFAEGGIRLRNHFVANRCFHSQALISQPKAIFVGGSFRLRNLTDHECSLAPKLLLTYKDLLFLSLQFLLQ